MALGMAALRRGGGAAPRLLAVAVSCQSCRPRASQCPGDGGHGQPKDQQPAAPGRARRGAEPGPAAGSQPLPAEGADTKTYLWARYHEMKKLVYGKSRSGRRGCRLRRACPFSVFFPRFFSSAPRCLSPGSEPLSLAMPSARRGPLRRLYFC